MKKRRKLHVIWISKITKAILEDSDSPPTDPHKWTRYKECPPKASKTRRERKV